MACIRGSHHISTGQYWSRSIKCNQQWLSNSWAFSLRVASVESLLRGSSEHACCRRPLEGEIGLWWGAEAGRGQELGWACRLPPSPGSEEESEREGFPGQGPGHKGVAAGQKAHKWRMITPEHPRTGLGWPFPHCPADKALFRLRFSDLLICIPLPGLRLDLQPCFPKAGLPPHPPAPRGLLQPPLPNRVTRNAAPLLK